MRSATRPDPGNISASAYAAAGVDIDEKMAGIDAIKRLVRTTATPGVLSDIGPFGGMFRSPGRDHILVASTDGVGTKIKVAVMAGRHDTVGQDLVNHCVNDILAQGADPLFFLDYIGTSRVDRRVMAALVRGLCLACRQNGCALLGGETAEMPGVYPPDEYDLVGTIVGSVPRREVITGETIRCGDRLIGLPSTGLHTNGYSLARKIIFETAGLGLKDRIPGVRGTVEAALLAVHRSYLRPIRFLRRQVRIRGLAHITGGGFPDNIRRILPSDVDAVVDRTTWTPPVLFRFLMEAGRVDREEMYRVFNMGIGFVIVVRPNEVETALSILRRSGCLPYLIGEIVRGSGQVRLER
jgi:phosphoribosylformylglycinamidine cyclo-ligase